MSGAKPETWKRFRETNDDRMRCALVDRYFPLANEQFHHMGQYYPPKIYDNLIFDRLMGAFESS